MNITRIWLIIGIAALCSLCFVSGSITNQKGTIEYIYFERPIYKIDQFQNYSNDEVRSAINYTVYYFNDPDLLKAEDHPAWIQWDDYKSRVADPDYNYWILSYAFGV